MRFAIVGLQRTGSSSLINLLGRHGEIHCCGEIFNPSGINLRWPETLGGRPAGRDIVSTLKEIRESDPQEFLKRVFALDFGKPVVGFKIFRKHNPPMLERILDDRDIAKIIHSRDNGLARYASLIAARKTDGFTGTAEKPLVKFNAVQFAEFYREHTTFFEETAQRLTASGQNFHRSHFEDLNNPARLEATLKFLGVASDVPPLQEPPVNRGSSDVLSRFSNPEAAEAYLQAHNLMHWARE